MVGMLDMGEFVQQQRLLLLRTELPRRGFWHEKTGPWPTSNLEPRQPAWHDKKFRRAPQSKFVAKPRRQRLPGLRRRRRMGQESSEMNPATPRIPSRRTTACPPERQQGPWP